MSKFIGNNEIIAKYYGNNQIMAVYKGEMLVWQSGNFYTADGESFVTSDNEIFEVKED